MSDIKERLALRATISRRLEASGSPEYMGVIWAMEAGYPAETNAQIIFLGARCGRLFRHPMTEAMMEQLVQIIEPSVVPVVLEGLTVEIEAGGAGTLNLNTLTFLLPALQAVEVDYTKNFRALLKGRLLNALCHLMSVDEAHVIYEGFASKDIPEHHCTIFNSYYGDTFERLAAKDELDENDRAHLSAIGRSAHFNFYNDEAQTQRWIPQFKSLGDLAKKSKPVLDPVLAQLIEGRAQHLGQWFSIHAPVSSICPFSGVKSVTSSPHAHKVMDAMIMMAKCVNQLPDDNPAARGCFAMMFPKVFLGLARFADKLGRAKWAALEEQVATKLDWKQTMEQIPHKHRRIIVENFHRMDLFGDYLSDHEVTDKFEADLGL